MIIADWYELAVIFNEDDFIKGAAVFFQYLQYIEQGKVVSYSKDVDRWVYHLLGYDVYLSKEELAAIKQIKLAGEISSVCISDTEKIRLFTIELQPWVSRSQVAHTIHKLFAKGIENYSVILFGQKKEENRECLLSIDVGDTIILSDWFSAESDVTPLLSINGSYLSSLSAKDFQLDLSYEIGRSYYRAPDTPAIIRYELLQYNSRAYVLTNGEYDWQQLHDDVDDLYIGPLRTYGDDYIEPPSKEIKDDEDISIDDIVTPFEDVGNANDEIVKIEDLTEPKEKDEIDQLLVKLGEDFDDPAKLLKALSNLETQNNSERPPLTVKISEKPFAKQEEPSKLDGLKVKMKGEIKEHLSAVTTQEIVNNESALFEVERSEDISKNDELLKRVLAKDTPKDTLKDTKRKAIEEKLVEIRNTINELMQRKAEKKNELKNISSKAKEGRIFSRLTKRLNKLSKNPWQRKTVMQITRMTKEESRLRKEIDDIAAQEVKLKIEEEQYQKKLKKFPL